MQFGVTLVVAMQPDAAQIDSGALYHRELTTGANVDAESLLGHPTCHRRTQEGLGGVVDVPSIESVGEGVSSGAQIGLIHHVHRGPDLIGNVNHAQASHVEHTVLVLAYAATPETRKQGVDVARHA
jgi:hypothetical protein